MIDINIRIPENIRTEMEKYNDVDWTKIILNAIETQIQRIKKRINMLKAAEELDEIRLRIKPVKKGEIGLWIREDRAR